MAEAVYVLCALTSLVCAALLMLRLLPHGSTTPGIDATGATSAVNALATA